VTGPEPLDTVLDREQLKRATAPVGGSTMLPHAAYVDFASACRHRGHELLPCGCSATRRTDLPTAGFPRQSMRRKIRLRPTA